MKASKPLSFLNGGARTTGFLTFEDVKAELALALGWAVELGFAVAVEVDFVGFVGGEVFFCSLGRVGVGCGRFDGLGFEILEVLTAVDFFSFAALGASVSGVLTARSSFGVTVPFVFAWVI